MQPSRLARGAWTALTTHAFQGPCPGLIGALRLPLLVTANL